MRYKVGHLSLGWRIAVTVSAILFCHIAMAATDTCSPMARTPLERLYCQIVQKGEGRSLPALEDFRRNTPQIQSLLLKRPAQKLGLTLPEASSNTPASANKEQKEKTTPKRQSALTQKPEPQKSRQNAGTPEANQCKLNNRSINCPGETYRLVENLPNSALAPIALTDANKLQLPGWHSGLETTEREYLTSAYRIYVDKMLQIGLGAATMSFTRFYHNYQDSKEQNTNFRKRFADMYEYLKKDKLTMSTPKRLVDGVPEGINFCDYLKKDLIVCDNGFHNWLYLAD